MKIGALSPGFSSEIDRPFPSMTDFPEDRVRFESVPQVAERPNVEFEVSEIEDTAPFVHDDTWVETRQLDTVAPEPYVIDELFEEDEVESFDEVQPFEEEELSVRHRESMLDRFLRQRRERKYAPAYTEDWNVEEAQTNAGPSGERVHRDAPIQGTPQPMPQPQSRKIADLPSSLDDDFVLPPPLPKVQAQPVAHAAEPTYRKPLGRQEPSRRPERSESVDLPVADEFGNQPLFAANLSPAVEEDYAIDPRIENGEASSYLSQRTERICQTCRDFRPSDDGERGWCNNKWAFNHRRMVDAEDLACRNSIGSWWTPKDDLWRRDGDISRHAPANSQSRSMAFRIRS